MLFLIEQVAEDYYYSHDGKLFKEIKPQANDRKTPRFYVTLNGKRRWLSAERIKTIMRERRAKYEGRVTGETQTNEIR